MNTNKTFAQVAAEQGYDIQNGGLQPDHPLNIAWRHGFSDAICLVLAYLNERGECGSDRYIEILNMAGREETSRWAVAQGPHEVAETGLDRHVREAGVRGEPAMLGITDWRETLDAAVARSGE